MEMCKLELLLLDCLTFPVLRSQSTGIQVEWFGRKLLFMQDSGAECLDIDIPRQLTGEGDLSSIKLT